MADKKISALTNRPAESLAGTDEVALRVGAGNFKASLTSIATWIATQLTAFVTLTGIQTLTNKSLTNPVINGGAFTASGTLIDTLQSSLTSTNAVVENILDSIGSTGGYGIVNLTDEQTLTNKTLNTPVINSEVLNATGLEIDLSSGWCSCATSISATDSKYTLTAATILAMFSETPMTKIDYTKLFVQVAEINSNIFTLLPSSAITIYKDAGTQQILDKIVIDTVSGKTYLVTLNFKTKEPAGA